MEATLKNVKASIGKKMQWEEFVDHWRGTSIVRTGTIQEVTGGNVLLSGDYKYLKDLRNPVILSDNIQHERRD